MSPEYVGIIGIAVMFLLMAFRLHIGIAMALVGFLGFSYLSGISTGLSLFGMVPYQTASFYTFSIIPLFVLMGQFAFYSGMSEDIYRAVHKWMGHFPGGLGMATILGCAGFAAISGSSLATAATMGTVALPEMRKYKYNEGLATGSIAAGGTLGILIPPSIGFVIYGILTEESIGRLLLAGILPGILLAGLYMLTIYVICKRNPEMGPPGAKSPLKEKLLSLTGVWGMLLLFALVMGGIYAGIFTPIEAAGVGAFGALLIAILRKRMNLTLIIKCLQDTLQTTAMIFLILIGAEIFTLFLGVSKLPMLLADVIGGLPFPRYLILSIILLLYVVLGCVLDGIAMIVLTIPIIFPVITAIHFDPIWFGVLMVIVLEMGLITPPVGLNVFIIKGVAKDIPLGIIFKGVIPFLVASVVAIVVIMIFPDIALFIPIHMR
ncbi:MAG TPA: C4-dicarboxylate ABC transporter permease [Desulfobacteraceae bacterium]|nr:C4-dicarboxylate ABC transporter permease [Desulfobacteraceae bacterium]